jgi:hypothetical protein
MTRIRHPKKSKEGARMSETEYTYEILEDNTAIVYYRGEEVWRSRPFRLYVQAVTKAKDFIVDSIGKAQNEGITLDVQNLRVDANSLFGGKRHG